MDNLAPDYIDYALAHQAYAERPPDISWRLRPLALCGWQCPCCRKVYPFAVACCYSCVPPLPDPE